MGKLYVFLELWGRAQLLDLASVYLANKTDHALWTLINATSVNIRIFQRYFHIGNSLDQIYKYVRLVLKTFDPDDDIEVTYEDQSEAQFVRIVIFDRVLN